MRRLPDTPVLRELRGAIAREFQLQDGDPLTSSSLCSAIAEAFTRLELLERRLASAEGVVTRCGYCGAPLPLELRERAYGCRYCGSESRA